MVVISLDSWSLSHQNLPSSWINRTLMHLCYIKISQEYCAAELSKEIQLFQLLAFRINIFFSITFLLKEPQSIWNCIFKLKHFH